jgi:hypothetical protein
VKTGTVPEVPERVTVCAAALIANAAMQIATAAILLSIVFLSLSLPICIWKNSFVHCAV